MSDDIITAENVSKALIKSVFESAFMDVSLDGDGDVLVKDRCMVLALPEAEKKRIRLLTIYRFVPTASDVQMLTLANTINTTWLFVRATVVNKRLFIDYDLSLEAGISKKSLVLMLKRFASIGAAAVVENGKDLIQ